GADRQGGGASRGRGPLTAPPSRLRAVPSIAQVEPTAPSAGGLGIARVQPITTTRALQGPFDYMLPEALRDGTVSVGSMLVVPFGRREVLGVVVGLAEHSDVAEERLLAPLRALELGVPADLVELGDCLAAACCA